MPGAINRASRPSTELNHQAPATKPNDANHNCGWPPSVNASPIRDSSRIPRAIGSIFALERVTSNSTSGSAPQARANAPISSAGVSAALPKIVMSEGAHIRNTSRNTHRTPATSSTRRVMGPPLGDSARRVWPAAEISGKTRFRGDLNPASRDPGAAAHFELRNNTFVSHITSAGENS